MSVAMIDILSVRGPSKTFLQTGDSHFARFPLYRLCVV